MKKTLNNFLNLSKIKNNKLFIPFLFFIVFVFSITLYLPTTNYDINGIDDDTFIRITSDKYSVKDIFTKNVFLSDTDKTYYRPVLTLSFMADNFINQSPATMHTTNVLLHAVCTGLIFFFFKKYFFNTTISFLAALLFAAHPINIFTAAWLPGRNDSLVCIFFLLCLIFFLEYLKRDKTKFLLLHFIFLTVAVFTKETAIILPAVCLCYWFIYEKSFNKRFFIISATQFFIVMVFLVIYKNLSYDIFKPTNYLLTMIHNLKTVLDYYSSTYFFNIHFSSYFDNKTAILGITAVLLSFIFSYFSGLKTKGKIFYFVLPFIMLIISLLAERLSFQGNRVYIPLIFMIIPFCSFLQTFCTKKIIYTFLVLLIIMSVTITVKKQKTFQNELTFFETADSEQENYDIYMANWYSYSLLKYGNLEKAAVKARQIAQKTEYKNTFNLYVLSIVYMHEKNYDKAVNILERIVNFDKTDIYTKLVVCYDMLGNKEKSLYYYNMLSEINNNDTKKINELIAREKNVL